MAYTFKQRFGANGIYTDLRVLLPLLVAIFVAILGWNLKTPEERVMDYAMQRAERSLSEFEGQPLSSKPPPRPAPVYSDRTQASWLPIVAAGAAGALLLGIGVVGSLLILRNDASAEEP